MVEKIKWRRRGKLKADDEAAGEEESQVKKIREKRIRRH